MNKCYGLLLSLIISAFLLPANAGELIRPARFELGIGAVTFSAPDYVGSSRNQSYLLPFPYVKYRGKRLEVDDGAEFKLFKTEDLKLSVSGNGSLPSSEDNPERQGMQQLAPTLELGPSLEYRLRKNYTTSLWLEFPIRAAITLDSDLDFIGLTSHPRIAWRQPGHFKYDWKFRVASGPVFSNNKYISYYYDVNASDATASRPVFDAQQGYTGWRTDFTYSRRIDKYWLGGFVRHDAIGSNIQDSPLVNDNSNLTAGISLAYVISER